MSEWISVEDELPRVGEWYLISTKDNGPQKAFTTMSFLDTQVDGDNLDAPIWLTHNDSYRLDSGNGEYEGVTHWMPLPKPPKGLK